MTITPAAKRNSLTCSNASAAEQAMRCSSGIYYRIFHRIAARCMPACRPAQVKNGCFRSGFAPGARITAGLPEHPRSGTKPAMVARAIPCVLMRGGTSRGPYLLASDLPAEPEARDEVLIRIMGSGHELQVDGIGGGHPLTSKVAIVS